MKKEFRSSMTRTMSTEVEASKKGSESIHSGQFMVSHFEAEETQDDEDELEMPEESDDSSNLATRPTTTLLYKTMLGSQPMPSTSTQCLELQRLPDPKKLVTQVEIDSDLSQVFNTLNVTYKQKLTSPKWNPFKGIRLRWKEKIRLNNVIWRCWFMQFVLKKRPLICFASPLDVDIHNTPQAIILEGKYWKRKWKVITAEYKKWRRFNAKKALEGSSIILDTKSEVDTFEWATSDNLLMLSDNMSSDTLFSTISQFPFPDPREIARGAGRADFIQPSLGPLQPNLDDFMELDLDIFNTIGVNHRLEPVQEIEEPQEFFKAIESNFPIIESMDPSNMQDLISSTTSQATNIPDSGVQMSVDQQGNDGLLYTATIFAQDISNVSHPTEANILNIQQQSKQQQQTQQQQSQQQQQIQQQSQQHQQQQQQSSQQQMSHISQMSSNVDPFMSGQISISQQAQQHMMSMGEENKDNFKKFNRYQKPFPKREPHNYDKCQPTPHQTNIYNQMMAQQTPFNANEGMPGIQSNQQNNYSNQSSAITSGQDILNLSSQNQQQQLQDIASKMISMLHPSQQLNQQSQFAQMHSQSLPLNLNPQQQQQQAQQLTTMGPLSTSTQDIYKSPQSQIASRQMPYKIPSQSPGGFNTGNRIKQSPPHGQTAKTLQQQQQQQKEMYRSNSLPLNATVIQLQNLPKEDNFVMPRYQGQASKGQRASPQQQQPQHQQHHRSRSNSMIMRQGQGHLGFQVLQAACSEPALSQSLSASSALLAQLLTTNHGTGIMGKSQLESPQQQQQQQQQSASVSNTPSVQTPQTSNASSQSSSSSSYLYSVINSPDSAIDPDLPLSPERSSGGSGLLSKYQPRESQRRAGHIHAEQKRRYNIKNGFDMLHSLIPQLQQNPNAKLSKASMLQKGADYIKQLRMERSAVHEQMEALRKEIDTLNNSLNHLHSALPANGSNGSMARQGNIKEMYNDYVMQQTKQNWKFWIFGLIFEPLLNSYNSTVSVASLEELCRTTQLWVDNNCSLVEIRPAVSNKLRELSTTTDILDKPVQEEVMRIVADTSNSKKHKQNTQNENPS